MDQQNLDSNILTFHRQQETIDRLKSGDITDISGSFKRPADAIVMHALNLGFLHEGFKSFPDPRSKFSVPMDAILLSQILRSLNDQHSFLLAPYMLNNADVMTTLGYNIKTLEDGFNEQNIHPREAAFNGETLKHILLKMRPDSIVNWFNQKMLPHWRNQAPGRTQQYILDGTKILVPSHLKDKFQNCGMVSDNDGNVEYGYKVVFLYEIIDRKGMIVSMKIGPIQTHDIVLGRELVEDFPFEKGACLIMDRGFIDGSWISELKLQRQVDVVIPLRHNMQLTEAAIAQADARDAWEPHPTREGQWCYELEAQDLFWSECQVLRSGVLVRWQQKNGESSEVLFVTTNRNIKGKNILEVYDQRAEIEESHRQMKCFQGLEKLLSKKFVNVVFRLVIGVVGYNLFNLFLNSENCDTFEEYSLKTLRQKPVVEKNPKLIIYADDCFAVIRILELLPMILNLKKRVREKLANLFRALQLDMAPS